MNYFNIPCYTRYVCRTFQSRIIHPYPQFSQCINSVSDSAETSEKNTLAYSDIVVVPLSVQWFLYNNKISQYSQLRHVLLNFSIHKHNAVSHVILQRLRGKTIKLKTSQILTSLEVGALEKKKYKTKCKSKYGLYGGYKLNKLQTRAQMWACCSAIVWRGNSACISNRI